MRHRLNSPIGIAHRTPQKRSVFPGEWCAQCRERFVKDDDVTWVVWGSTNMVSYSPIHPRCVEEWLSNHEHYRLTTRKLRATFDNFAIGGKQ